MMLLMFQNLSWAIYDSAVYIAHFLLAITCEIVPKSWVTIDTSRRRSQFMSQDPSICRQIIAGVIQHHQCQNIIPPNASRAIVNQPLKVAFGIDNAFTRSDDSEVSSFVTAARAKMNLSADGWFAVSRFARATTRNWSVKQCPLVTHSTSQLQGAMGSHINIASMAQILTLRVVLRVMFDKTDQDKICDMSILTLAQSINRAWIAQKGAQENQILRFEDDVPMQEALFDIFGTRNIMPGNNPLNIILPSFETMWRIVLRTVLEIGFVGSAEHPEWESSVVAFAMEPTKRQFELDQNPRLSSRSSSHGQNISSSPHDSMRETFSAKHLVFESLRLYVPTRRVHRAYQWSENAGSHETLSADIEGCHLRRDIWGDDAKEFNPSRWLNLTHIQKEAFMPFGCVPFECPAKPTFGPRMIGLLAGAILEAFGELSTDVGWRLVCDDKGVPEHLRSGQGLSLDRTAYGDLFLARAPGRHSMM
ncbi:unnamed protein product [Penicillium olsonii]|nr:unnamed protein product [Penicillium olsonii]